MFELQEMVAFPNLTGGSFIPPKRDLVGVGICIN